ncbi:hypothetical protein CSC94_17085 [Zhengella mangrovi]|uniref:Uncharacterized protein n=1 Tax=Zhengella mangrovi TaxID=1982044 RepID=A0A2G1QK14_9HYPH|nr:hypothetical protein [Zhengella mangrovi]PHP65801.1 hypothetical protein CSC94_17085 [Zhengella mangrovi]
MSKPARVERDLLVFSIWAVLGSGGLCFLLEGFSRDSYLLSLIGIAAIVASFVAHFIVNGIFGVGFGPGEAALGIGVFGVILMVFIGGWAIGALSESDYWSGLTLFAVLALGLPVYLSTRYGLRGAFSHFHVRHADFEDSDQ